jgi:hypothetical protein
MLTIFGKHLNVSTTVTMISLLAEDCSFVLYRKDRPFFIGLNSHPVLPTEMIFTGAVSHWIRMIENTLE